MSSRILRPRARPRLVFVSARPPAPANDPAPADPEVLTVDELAAMLRMSAKHIYEMCAGGRIPGALKVDNAWRVHRPTVVAWLSGQVGAPKPRKRGQR